ncbi:MAG: aminotransferase class III-fold pyridoxal phosphate-dependent enzyme [Flavobacteriales bacterium]
MIKDFLSTYGLRDAAHTKLEGYGSVNYKLSHGENDYVLKYYSDLEELSLIESENNVLRHLSSFPDLNTPKVMAELMPTDIGFVRLLSYVKGSLLKKEHLTSLFLSSLGRCIATLHLKLADLNEPIIAARISSWDLNYTHTNASKTEYVKDPTQRKLVAHFLDRFSAYVLPQTHSLRSQIIHGDLNENNLLVNDKGELNGIIDFGDICYGPIINEIAIACTYVAMLAPENFLSNITHIIAGYHSISALQRKEISLIYDLIAARLCTSVLHSAESKGLNGATEYILQNEAPAWHLMEIWSYTSPVLVKNHFLNALGCEVKEVSSKSSIERRKKVASPSLSLSYSTPIHMESSLFQYMFDDKGNRYLDAYNNIPHVGHCHPHVIEAISKQVRKLNTNTRYLYSIYTDYSDHLLSYFPSRLNKLLLVNSGSAASDLAIRMARVATGRTHIAVLDHGYHGNTMLAIEASAYKFDGKGGSGAASHIIKLPLPNTFNSFYSDGKSYADEAITLLREEISQGNTPALFIAEPVSGCGGQVPLAPGYLEHMLPFLQEHGILFASDEVQTGFGRLGSHFWGFQLHNVEPDIVILGKPIGNGHPMGGVVTSDQLTHKFANGMEFFSSFGGNPVSCAAGKAVLEVLEREHLQANALNVGGYWKDALLALQRKFDVMADVRGYGIFLGVEFLDHDNSPLTQLAGTVKNKLKENFILSSTDGPYDHVLKMKPPLCFSKANADEFVSVLERILMQLI